MEKQQTFTDIEYTQRKRKGKREKFLETMNAIIPWSLFEEKIKPYYPQGKRGRPPKGIEQMRRMYFLQIWFNLADEALEEQIYDSYAMRKFMRLDFFNEQVPDATTLLLFRQLLEKNNLQKELFEMVKEALERDGKLMHGGTIVDATIIEAPSSTKNSGKSRNPEMKQTKKGNEWYFGMKAHIGVDAGSGLVHSVEATSANVHDGAVVHRLIRADDEFVNGDAGYTGIEKREEIRADAYLSQIEYRINKRKGTERKRHEALMSNAMKHLYYIAQPAWEQHYEYMKSKVRSKVEHIFAIIKRKFGYRKVAYRGIAKNLARLYMLFCSANLLKWAWSLT